MQRHSVTRVRAPISEIVLLISALAMQCTGTSLIKAAISKGATVETVGILVVNEASTG